MKNYNKHHPIHNQGAKTDKGRKRSQTKECEMTNDKRIGFERLEEGRSSKNAEWKQVVAREKTKFKTNIRRGKKEGKME